MPGGLHARLCHAFLVQRLIQYKKLSRCSDSATCEPLDAAEVQYSTFFPTRSWSSSEEFGNLLQEWIPYYDPGRLRHAASQDTDLLGHMSTANFCSKLLLCVIAVHGETIVMLVA